MIVLICSMIIISISLYAETDISINPSQDILSIKQDEINNTKDNDQKEILDSQDILNQDDEAPKIPSIENSNQNNINIINDKFKDLKKVVDLKNAPDQRFYNEVSIMCSLYPGKYGLLIDTLDAIKDMRFRSENNIPLETPSAEYLHKTLTKEDQEKLFERLRKMYVASQQKPIKQEKLGPSFLDGFQQPLGIIMGSAISLFAVIKYIK